MRITSLDLADNISALATAICSDKFLTVEEAFAIVERRKTKFSPTLNDKEDMYNFKKEGMTYRAIGEMYGMHYDNVFKIIKNYKRKKETLQGGNLTKSSDKENIY